MRVQYNTGVTDALLCKPQTVWQLKSVPKTFSLQTGLLSVHIQTAAITVACKHSFCYFIICSEHRAEREFQIKSSNWSINSCSGSSLLWHTALPINQETSALKSEVSAFSDGPSFFLSALMVKNDLSTDLSWVTEENKSELLFPLLFSFKIHGLKWAETHLGETLELPD